MFKNLKALMIAPVIVGALGYFVDIYDLVLFSIVRVPSLKGLGFEGQELLNHGVLLINMQMIGMLVGGLIWGVLGDKKGRISVLFGSILLYSTANLLNAFVTTIPAYAILRFIAGVGLAGELGAAITLVSESLPTRLRGYGTSIVASFGICGALLAGYIGEAFDWKIAYFVGGILGLALLVLRIKMKESALYSSVKQEEHIKRGDLVLLLGSWDRFKRYALCILIGVPLWYAVGLLITFSPEIARTIGVEGEISAGRGILMFYAGLAVGDLGSGLISQWLKSRRGATLIFMILSAASTVLYFKSSGFSTSQFYAVCVLMGIGYGYWALFVTIAAEQFGTNLRATVAISVPNFVRGAVVPLTMIFQWMSPQHGTIGAAAWIGVGVFAISLLALYRIDETFHKDLHYLE